MAVRTSCNFGIEPPRFTPADRLQALHEVAEAARGLRDEGYWYSGKVRIAETLARLDEIEAYLGVPGRKAGA